MIARHLYVHVPFCARRCVYCDFSIAVRSTVPDSEYLDALTREMAMRHAADGQQLDTVYLGGGTPSKLAPDSIASLLDLISGRATLSPTAEVTLEANPEDVTPERARVWRESGVNRVSLGVQSFQPEVLAWMHRTHTAPQAHAAVAALRHAGIENISIDLIFALPEALQRGWEDDLSTGLALEVPHISVYGLTVEPHTPLARRVARRDAEEAPEEWFVREFLAASDALGRAGYRHYEVSNYARAGYESRHNQAYWNRRPYIGLGPSAHEFDGTTRRWNAAPYAEWLHLLQSDRDPVSGGEVLTPEQQTAEEVYLGLRTSGGVCADARELEFLRGWVNAGWATLESDRVVLTATGWLRLDSLSAALTHVRSRY